MKDLLALHDLLPRLNKDLQTSILKVIEDNKISYKAVNVKRVEIETKGEEQNDEERSITAYLSTRHLDRDNEIIMPDGIDVGQFKQNPVILIGHNYGQPQVGKAESLRHDEIGLKAKIVFAPVMPVEKDYYLLSKFMPLKFSIGFIPIEIMDNKHAEWKETIKKLSTDWPEFKGKNTIKAIHRKLIMLEASITPMPANVYASQISKALEEGKIKAEECQIIRKSLEPDAETGKIEGVKTPDLVKIEGAMISLEEKEFLDLMESSIPCLIDGLSILITRPYENEHSGRIENPDKYDEFRRQNDKFGAGIHAIFGILKGPPRKVELQAIRFSADKFTAEEARKWLKDHDYKPISFEAAKGEGKTIKLIKHISKVTLISTAENEQKKIAEAVKNELALRCGRI